MSKSAATVRDIARLLGISKSTVSRALNDHHDVNQDTARKVRELALEIDYHPNLLAQHLKQQHTNTIGVIIPETVNRFFAKAVGGIQHIANKAGYNVMICQSNESIALERNNLRTLLASKVDGLLISVSKETDRHDHFQSTIEKEIPLVFFDRIIEELDTSMVHTNNYDISFAGTEHLIAQGCKRIAFIAGPQHLYNSRNRLNGYIGALRKHDFAIDESMIVETTYGNTNVDDYTRRLLSLKARPDAIFAINDMAALEIMHILKKKGLRVPHDVAILGFNNETICNLVEPTLSSIDHPAFDIGAAAAEILLKIITNSEVPREKRLIKSRLVVRESSNREM